MLNSYGCRGDDAVGADAKTVWRAFAPPQANTPASPSASPRFRRSFVYSDMLGRAPGDEEKIAHGDSVLFQMMAGR